MWSKVILQPSQAQMANSFSPGARDILCLFDKKWLESLADSLLSLFLAIKVVLPKSSLHFELSCPFCVSWWCFCLTDLSAL